jgi:D-3-phosphoglycerate dehydrogenase
MFTIKRFNKISDIVYKHLDAQRYVISDDAEEYDAALVRSADLHAAELPERLIAVARAGAGVNNIPIQRCTERGIAVFNTPGANANAVKELVICGLLLAGRQVVPGIEWLQALHGQGSADIPGLVEKGKGQFVGPELAGKRLGVIGLGAVGVMVANAADKGLGMEVVGYDPYMSVEAAWNLTRSVLHAKSLEEIFESCDYITLHLPLDEKTRGMVGETAIASMKQGAVLLNFARGGLVDNRALLAALESGHLRHYVTDFPDDEVMGHPGIIATPHLGASTPESEENCAEMAARQLRDYLEDGNIVNAVNLPRCELPRSGEYRAAFIHRNIKNMVGQITAVLACEGLNIERMVNSSLGDWAYTLIDLSGRPPESSLARLSAIEGVVRVRIL